MDLLQGDRVTVVVAADDLGYKLADHLLMLFHGDAGRPAVPVNDLQSFDELQAFPGRLADHWLAFFARRYQRRYRRRYPIR